MAGAAPPGQGSNASREGGYIVLDLPEDHRSLFVDLLKGFEEFAALKGYRVAFSFDAQSTDRVAFKFTITDSGISVSTNQVRRDFEDYIKRVKTGECLDDLPVVLSPAQHDLILTTMKNRINFLQHNYNLVRNSVEYYERLLRSSVGNPFGHLPAVLVQTGGTLDSRSYVASKSPQVIQGDSNREILQEADQSIYIASSFNERAAQVEGLEKLIQLLSRHAEAGAAVANLNKIKDEITDEASPNSRRIWKWLERAKLSMEATKLSAEIIEAAKGVYSSFRALSLLGVLLS